MFRSDSSARNASRLQTQVASAREIRIGRFLVDRAMRRSRAVSPALVKLVRRQCLELGYDSPTATSGEQEQITREVATRIAPYVRAAMRRQRRNRETVLFDPRDTRMM